MTHHECFWVFLQQNIRIHSTYLDIAEVQYLVHVYIGQVVIELPGRYFVKLPLLVGWKVLLKMYHPPGMCKGIFFIKQHVFTLHPSQLQMPWLLGYLARIIRYDINPYGAKHGLSRQIWSIAWLLMAWLASAGHQQPWYWLCRINRSLSATRKDFNHQCNF